MQILNIDQNFISQWFFFRARQNKELFLGVVWYPTETAVLKDVTSWVVHMLISPLEMLTEVSETWVRWS